MRQLAAGLAVAALTALAGASHAEVLASTAGGFVVQTKAIVAGSPARAYAAMGEIDRWWDPAHTLSGDASHLLLQPRLGGCLCEMLPGGGGAGWMLVVLADPGHTMRLRGGLGPLQAEGADGALTWSFSPAPQGTEITVIYAVSGFPRENGQAYAAPVDQVLGAALRRLKAYLASHPTAPPTTAH